MTDGPMTLTNLQGMKALALLRSLHADIQAMRDTTRDGNWFGPFDGATIEWLDGATIEWPNLAILAHDVGVFLHETDTAGER